MRKLLVGVLFTIGLFPAAFGLYACEMRYSLLQPDGNRLDVSPGSPVILHTGESYVLQVEFVQDHRKCVTPAEETVYLVDEEKWKETKEYLPLQLLSQSNWVEVSPGRWEQEIGFQPVRRGECVLEVIRECPKGGYDERLVFQVS
jgi:hypothetical protein